MTAIVVSDCDCDLIAAGCGFEGLVVEHFDDDQAACLQWRYYHQRWLTSFGPVAKSKHDRYFAIHTSRGHVIGIRP